MTLLGDVPFQEGSLVSSGPDTRKWHTTIGIVSLFIWFFFIRLTHPGEECIDGFYQMF